MGSIENTKKVWRYLKENPKPSITNIADQLLSKKVASYFRSRGLINSMGARFNTLSSEERDQLRTMFSFAPSQVKPLIFGKVFELEDNQAVTGT